jgi:succinate dehydrogenase hydrophobic anchor subunit
MKHWVLERLSSILLIPICGVTLLALVSPVLDTLLGNSLAATAWVIGLVVVVVLFYHIQGGIESVLRDYVHTPKVLLASRFVLNVIRLCLAKDIYLYFVATFA